MGNRGSIGGLETIGPRRMNALLFNSKTIIYKIIILILFTNVFSQSTFHILNQTSDAKMMAFSNGASIIPSNMISANPASVKTDKPILRITQINLPANIYINEISLMNNWKNGIIFGKIKSADYGEIIDGINKQKTDANDLVVEVGYKTTLKNLISIGITSGYIKSEISGARSTGIFTNLGVRFHIIQNRLGIGASFNNLGTQLEYYDSTPEEFPTTFRTGCYFMPLHLPATFNLDILKNIIDDKIQYIGGIEFYQSNNLALRISTSSYKKDLSTGDYYKDLFSGFAMGMGFSKGNIEIDFSTHNMGPAGQAMGLTISWKQM